MHILGLGEDELVPFWTSLSDVSKAFSILSRCECKSHVPEIANITKQISFAHHCAFANARAVTMTLEQLLLH